MGVADNLNLDVLESVFAFLPPSDAFSIALVSRSFFAAIIPSLYHTLRFRIREAKRYHTRSSPFAVILAHPHFALHVRYIDIRVLPPQEAERTRFIAEATKVIAMSSNLQGFRCTVPSDSALPPFLVVLQDKERLEELRVHARLTEDQVKILTKLSNIQRLAIEYASWQVVHILPTWTSGLNNITLYSSTVTEDILSAMLEALPRLTALHVISCPQLCHTKILRHLQHTPLLQALSLSTSDTIAPIEDHPLLYHLKHLSIHTRNPMIVCNIFEALKASFCPLETFKMKLQTSRKTLAIGEELIDQLVSGYSSTLQRMSFFETAIAVPFLVQLTSSCSKLVSLEIPFPMKEIRFFAHALSHSDSLTCVVDITSQSNHSHTSDQSPFLAPTQGTARTLMKSCPSLQTMVSGGRIWTRGKKNSLANIKLESGTPKFDGEYWFLPRTEPYQ